MKSAYQPSERPLAKQQRGREAKLAFKGVLFEVWHWEQTIFDGTKVLFETLRRPDTVLVIPVLPGGHIILAEERQPGVPVSLRALGGRIERGETPEEAAHRELQEESGYVARELRLWDAWQPVKKIDWAVYLFVAHGLSTLSDRGSLDPGEAITLCNVPIATLFERNSALRLDDYELASKLHFARSDDRERDRVIGLFASPP